MSDLATYYVNVVPSARGIGGTLAQEMEGAGEESGKKYGHRFAETVKKIIVAAGIGKILKDAISQGAALEQSIGGIETMFGDSASKMQKYAEQAFDSVGISANQYMEQVTSFSARLLQGLGKDTDKAADVANMAMIDMGDNANKFGTNIESIQNAYQGFAKQNFTMLDNLKLGYGGTASEMARLINDSGVMGKSFTATAKNVKDIPFDKMIEAIHQIQVNTGVAGTTADEAARTYSGSMNAMIASWQNLLGYVAIGSPQVGEAAKNLATTITTYLNNAIPMVIRIIQQLPETLITIVSGLAPRLIDEINQLIVNIMFSLRDLLPKVLEFGQELSSKIMTSLPKLINALTTMIMDVGQKIAPAIPKVIKDLLPKILEFATRIRENIGTFIETGINVIMALVDGFIEALPDLIAYVPQIVIQIADIINENMPKIIMMGINIIVALVKGIIQNIPVLISNAGKIVEAIWKTITAINWLNLGRNILTWIKDGIVNLKNTLPDKLREIAHNALEKVKEIDWLELGKSIIQGMINGIKGMGGALWNGMKSIVSGAVGKVKKFLGIHSPSTLFRDEVGKFMSLGIGEGFDKFMPTKEMISTLDNSLEEIATDTLGSLQTDFTIAANAMNGYDYGSSNVGTTNYGGVAINVYANDSQNAREIAEEVMNIMQQEVIRNRMVFE